MDSRIEFTENRYRPTPPQPGGRKRHVDEDTPQIPYTDVPDSMRTMPWDGPHKRILCESEDPDSTVSGSETQEARPGWPPDDMCADSTQYRGSFDYRDRERLRLLSPMLQQRVLKLQRDLEDLQTENRFLRTPRAPVPVPLVRQKYPGLMDQPVGNSIDKCLMR